MKREQDPNYVPSAENNLSDITVEDFLLSPVFIADKTEYVIWLPYETESVVVSGTASDGKASVQVVGEKNLVAGADNEIQVICTAEDGTEKIYTIIAKRAAAHDGSEETTPELPGEDDAEEPNSGETGDGISVVVLIIASVLCLAAGTGLGIVVDKKFMK